MQATARWQLHSSAALSGLFKNHLSDNCLEESRGQRFAGRQIREGAEQVQLCPDNTTLTLGNKYSSRSCILSPTQQLSAAQGPLVLENCISSATKKYLRVQSTSHVHCNGFVFGAFGDGEGRKGMEDKGRGRLAGMCARRGEMCRSSFHVCS